MLCTTITCKRQIQMNLLLKCKCTLHNQTCALMTDCYDIFGLAVFFLSLSFSSISIKNDIKLRGCMRLHFNQSALIKTIPMNIKRNIAFRLPMHLTVSPTKCVNVCKYIDCYTNNGSHRNKQTNERTDGRKKNETICQITIYNHGRWQPKDGHTSITAHFRYNESTDVYFIYLHNIFAGDSFSCQIAYAYAYFFCYYYNNFIKWYTYIFDIFIFHFSHSSSCFFRNFYFLAHFTLNLLNTLTPKILWQ